MKTLLAGTLLLLSSLTASASNDVIQHDYFHLMTSFATRERARATWSSDGALLEQVGALKSDLNKALGVLEGLEGVEEEVLEHAKALLPNETSECTRDLVLVMEGLAKKQPWALRMLDAMGKPESGILDGNVGWLGSYDECLNVVVPGDLTTSPDQFHTQYCYALASVKLMESTGGYIALGMCLPNTCNRTYMGELFSDLLQAVSNRSTQVTVHCQQQHEEFDSSAIAVIVVLSIFGLLLVLGTTYDIMAVQRPKWQEEEYWKGVMNGGVESSLNAKLDVDIQPELERAPLLGKNKTRKKTNEGGPIWARLLLSFSLYTNGQKLLNTQQTEGSLTAVHGIRFLSMTWVLLGHTLAFASSMFSNLLPFEKTVFDRWTYLVVTNGTVSVDSFFLLSGLLVAYLLVKEMAKVESVGKVKWGMFYFHRFWRLTPPYMLVMMTYVPLFVYLGSGPFWLSEGVDPNCKSYWWTNLLYINNFYDGDKMCMGWAWYLANDMQFFILSPLIIIPLFLMPMAGVAIAFVFLLATVISASVISRHYDLPAGPGPIMMIQNELEETLMDQYYMKPYCRMGPYIVGLLTGYILQRTKCKVKMNRILNLLGWSTAAAINLAVIYGLVSQARGTPLSPGVAAFYNGLHRTAWGVGLAWVVFACATGHGGFVNTLLSWKALVPLSRLTYCCYLVHPVIIYAVYYAKKSFMYMDDITFVYLFFGNLLATYGVALVVSLTFEAPMLGLEKVVFKKS